MASRIPWFERTFEYRPPVECGKDILERLRGTPARLEDRLADIPPASATRRPQGQWSIQENVGHLSDLEPLWRGRVEDFQDKKPVLRPADLSNQRTHEANHNQRSLRDVLAEFRNTRRLLVEMLGPMTITEYAWESRHPRLDQPMRLVDLAWFVAEHDDHHLVRISEMLEG